MLLVIALLGLLASTVFVMLPRSGSEGDIQLVAQQIRTELATVRSRARSGEDRAVFGLEITPTAYTSLKVIDGATTTIASEQLPTGIAATPGIIMFQSISGASNPVTITLSSSQASTSINITASGAIQ